MIDVNTLTLAQNTLLTQVSDTVSTVTHYAFNLLYLFAVLEVVFFGLLWAIQQSPQWGALCLKTLKIGLIFFVIANFSYLIQTLASSFALVGTSLGENSEATSFVFNPALLWQFGYDSSIVLLSAGTASNLTLGMTLILITLGMGTLCCFAFFGIQIILQLVGFYATAIISLLLLPFGVLTPAGNMLEQAFYALLQAGVRFATVLFVVGAAITTWQFFDLMDHPIDLNLNEALGLFITALLFAYLAARLPKLVANTVGQFRFSQWLNTNPENINLIPPQGASGAETSSIHSIQAATQITAASNTPPATSTAVNVAVQIPPQSQAAIQSLTQTQRTLSGQLAKAQQVNQSISEEILKQFKKSFKSEGRSDE